MEEQINRLVAWSKGELQGPFSVELHPTNLCNLNCVMCGTQIEHKRLMKENPDFHPSKYLTFELTIEKMIQIVQEGYFLGVKKWLLTGGGEPFVRKKTSLNVMKEIKKYGMYGNINTNGVLLNQQDIEQIIKMQWDMIMFSVDSHIPEVHDFIRGQKGTFVRLQAILESFKNLKKEMKTNLPKIVFNTVLCNENIKHIGDFVSFAHSVGCTDITFIPLIQFSSELEALELSNDEKKQFQKEIPFIEKTAAKYGIHTNIFSLKDNRQKSREHVKKDNDKNHFYDSSCFEPFLNLVIRMDGKYSPCCMIDNYSDSIANKSLSKVWYGGYFSDIRKAISHNKIPSGCSRCVHMQLVQNTQLREELRGKLP